MLVQPCHTAGPLTDDIVIGMGVGKAALQGLVSLPHPLAWFLWYLSFPPFHCILFYCLHPEESESQAGGLGFTGPPQLEGAVPAEQVLSDRAWSETQ